jgi:hypothetical protein
LDQQQELFDERNLNSRELRSPSKHLGNFFSSYSLSINKQENRVGSLFQKNFKRKEIDSEEYFKQMVIYTHLNPLKHGYADHVQHYPNSSYPIYQNSEDSFLNKKKTLEIFGGLDNFLIAHEDESDRY